LPAFTVFFVRRFVEEPPIFQAARQAATATKSKSKARWLAAFSPAILTLVYTQLPIDDTLMLLLGFPFEFFA